MGSAEDPTNVLLEKRVADLERALAEKDALIGELHSKLAQTQRHLESLKAIDRAKCLLIEAGATEEEAFSRMRTLSMNTRKPLSEVADAIILGHRARQ